MTRSKRKPLKRNAYYYYWRDKIRIFCNGPGIKSITYPSSFYPLTQANFSLNNSDFPEIMKNELHLSGRKQTGKFWEDVWTPEKDCFEGEENENISMQEASALEPEPCVNTGNSNERSLGAAFKLPFYHEFIKNLCGNETSQHEGRINENNAKEWNQDSTDEYDGKQASDLNQDNIAEDTECWTEKEALIWRLWVTTALVKIQSSINGITNPNQNKGKDEDSLIMTAEVNQSSTDKNSDPHGTDEDSHQDGDDDEDSDQGSTGEDSDQDSIGEDSDQDGTDEDTDQDSTGDDTDQEVKVTNLTQNIDKEQITYLNQDSVDEKEASDLNQGNAVEDTECWTEREALMWRRWVGTALMKIQISINRITNLNQNNGKEGKAYLDQNSDGKGEEASDMYQSSTLEDPERNSNKKSIDEDNEQDSNQESTDEDGERDSDEMLNEENTNEGKEQGIVGVVNKAEDLQHDKADKNREFEYLDNKTTAEGKEVANTNQNSVDEEGDTIGENNKEKGLKQDQVGESENLLDQNSTDEDPEHDSSQDKTDEDVESDSDFVYNNVCNQMRFVKSFVKSSMYRKERQKMQNIADSLASILNDLAILSVFPKTKLQTKKSTGITRVDVETRAKERSSSSHCSTAQRVVAKSPIDLLTPQQENDHLKVIQTFQKPDERKQDSDVSKKLVQQIQPKESARKYTLLLYPKGRHHDMHCKLSSLIGQHISVTGLKKPMQAVRCIRGGEALDCATEDDQYHLKTLIEGHKVLKEVIVVKLPRDQQQKEIFRRCGNCTLDGTLDSNEHVSLAESSTSCPNPNEHC